MQVPDRLKEEGSASTLPNDNKTVRVTTLSSEGLVYEQESEFEYKALGIKSHTLLCVCLVCVRECKS